VKPRLCCGTVEFIVTDELPEPMNCKSARFTVEPTEDAEDLETLRQAVAVITTEQDALQIQLQQATAVLEQKKTGIKELWRMICGQTEEYATLVVCSYG